jgi:hypothetical protein
VAVISRARHVWIKPTKAGGRWQVEGGCSHPRVIFTRKV